MGAHWTTFAKWMKEFIPEHLDTISVKNLNLSMENFENCRYTRNPDIDDELYLAAFLGMWLSGQVFGDSSMDMSDQRLVG